MTLTTLKSLAERAKEQIALGKATGSHTGNPINIYQIAEELLEAAEWRPIAEAPKDGAIVDLWCVNDMDLEVYGPGYRFTDCIWLTELTRAPRWIERSSEETVEDCGWRATHFRPLPAPPAQLGEDG